MRSLDNFPWIMAGVAVICLSSAGVIQLFKLKTPSQAIPASTIFTDEGTGCQYLASAQGGITPRLNIEGKPMCGTVIEKKVRKDV